MALALCAAASTATGLAVAGPVAGAVAPPSVGAGALDTSRAAVAGDWVVLQATGPVTWRAQGSARWRALANGQVLLAGSEVETGPAGDLILVLGGDRLVVRTASRPVLPARGGGEDRRLRVERGGLRVEVESRPARDVEVRTPLLSLAIQGTSIEVAVDREQNSALVLEGRITVTTLGEGPADLDAGEGLRQRAAPGAAPEQLAVAGLPARVDRQAPLRWHLAPPRGATTSAAQAAPGPIGSAAAAPAALGQILAPRAGSRAPAAQPREATAGSTSRPRCSRCCWSRPAA